MSAASIDDPKNEPLLHRSGVPAGGVASWTAGLLLLFVLGLLIPIPYSGPWSYGLGDLMHAPMFALLTWFLVRRWDRSCPLRPHSLVGSLRRLVWIGIGLMLFGIATELAQGLMGRSTTLHDAIANGLGITAAASWYVAVRLKQPRWLPQLGSYMLRVAALVCLVAASWDPAVRILDLVATYYSSSC